MTAKWETSHGTPKLDCVQEGRYSREISLQEALSHSTVAASCWRRIRHCLGQ